VCILISIQALSNEVDHQSVINQLFFYLDEDTNRWHISGLMKEKNPSQKAPMPKILGK
jgi:hypothetical protein